jgi:hypothetical protein
LIAGSKRKDYIIFPEDRLYPVKMKNRLPAAGYRKELLLLLRAKQTKAKIILTNWPFIHCRILKMFRFLFPIFLPMERKLLKKIVLHQYGRYDYAGNPFTKKINVPAQEMQSLWCGINVPKNIPAGIYKGKATITAGNAAPTVIDIALTVSDKTAIGRWRYQ